MNEFLAEESLSHSSGFLASNTAVLLGRMRLRLSGAYVRDVVSGFFWGCKKRFI